jgi:manganese transport system permease protein/manganese/iron transport system permease protein
MLERLLLPFQVDFMIYAMLIAALIGVVCAQLSCYLMLKGWSLMGDAISHAVLPGIVLAYICNLPLGLGAFTAGMLCASSTGWIKNHSRLKEDTTLGVVFTGLFAVGLVMFTKVTTDTHLNHILIGSPLGIEPDDFLQIIITAGVTLAIVLAKRKDLMLYLFDPNQARCIGLNTTFLHYLFLALVSATVVATLQAMGLILAIAMVIIPGCTAYMLSDKFDKMLLISSIIAVICSILGAYVAFVFNISFSACIVLAHALAFLLALVFGPKYGLLGRRRRIREAAARDAAENNIKVVTE